MEEKELINENQSSEVVEQSESTVDPIVELNEKLQQSEEKYLRLYAEFDNYRKRVQKDKEEIAVNTKVRMLTSILDMDNDLSFAIKSVKNTEAQDGLKLISSKLETFLKSQGIEEIQTETYDDELHEVISVMPSEEEKIIDVVSKGYTLNDKPFRYPKIILGRNA
jgi:molecular chaperone GrpE